MKKTRPELEQLQDVELFAIALNSGFGNKQITMSDAAPALTTSFCYGCGYSDTVFWTIPYTKQDTGLPIFSTDAREKIVMLLAREHLVTWGAVTMAEQALRDARNAHEDFLRAQSSASATRSHIAA